MWELEDWGGGGVRMRGESETVSAYEGYGKQTDLAGAKHVTQGTAGWGWTWSLRPGGAGCKAR